MPMQPHSGIPNNALLPAATQTASTWLLVRGLCRQQRHWEDFPKQLAQALNARVLCSDILGTGTEWQVTTPCSITQIMLQLRKQFRQQHPDVSYPIRLLGISMGGMICTEWARCFPNEVQCMVFINTSFKQFSPLYQRLKLNKIPTLIDILRSPPLQQEQSILVMTSHTQHNNIVLSQRWSRYAEQQPVSRQNALRQLYAASRFKPPTQPPIASILLLASTQDQLVDVRCSNAIATKWRCPLHYHPTAGHDLPLDDSHWVCQKIAGWLTD